MKRYLRFCLIFLISLALPLSGMAGVQASTEPCPMKTMGMAMMDGMGQDCCHDMKSPTEHCYWTAIMHKYYNRNMSEEGTHMQKT